MMFLIRFWRNLTKTDNVESDKYEINKFSTCTFSFRTFFNGSGFFRIGSGFSADPDPDSGKKFRSGSGSGKKSRIRNTDIYTSRHATSFIMNVVQLFYLCMQPRQCKLFKLDFMYRRNYLISVPVPLLFLISSPLQRHYRTRRFMPVFSSKWSELDQVINRPGALSPRQTVELYTNCRTFLREANRMCRSVWVDFNLQVWR